MDKIELRVANLNFTTFSENELVVEGVVNDGNWSQTLGGRRKFKERIEKGAFTRALNRALQSGRIDFLAEHDTNKVLSSTSNDSLKLWEDSNKGLCMRATICPTSWGKDTFELIKAGIIKSMSFGFNVIKDEWTNTRNEVANRVVKELHLLEVSAVRNPAYLSSTISARGLNLVEDIEIPDEVREDGEVQNEENGQKEEIIQTSNEVTETPKEPQADFEVIMEKMLKQFESMLVNYIPKQEVKEEVVQEIVEEVPQIIEEVQTEEPKVEEVIEQQTEQVAEVETEEVVEPTVVEQEQVDEKVEEGKTKSEIDYAIELLSKYKKIQELQK